MIFGRTQSAIQTPFDATDPAAIAAGISSTDVFNAIIEAKEDAINNDRYPIECFYNGNANSGRRLEIFPGLASDIAPLVLPENSKIIAYSFGATAISTGVLTIRNRTTLTDIVDITFAGQVRVTATNLILPTQLALSELEIYVKSGAFNRPFGRFWLNTVT